MAIRNNYRGNNMIRTTQKVSTFIGNTGPTGATGPMPGLAMRFNTATADSDKDAGDVWLNATAGSETLLSIDDVDVDANDVQARINVWDDSTTTGTRGIVTIYQAADSSNWITMVITAAITDPGSYTKFTVTHTDKGGTIANNDLIFVTFTRAGNKGATGSTGATGGATGGLDYVFETTTTDSDQGTGKVWLNNGTRSSATVLYIDDNDVDSTDVSAYIATWDDSTTTSTRGYVKIYQRADNSIFSIFNISGALTDATAYHKVPVSHLVSVGTIADEDPIDVFFSRTGNAGSGLAAVVSDTSPQLGGFLDANGNYIQMQKGGDISSASPLVIDTDGDYFVVTGTTNFSAMTVAADRHFFLEFAAILTITHAGGTIDIPGAANYTSVASDVIECVSTASNVVTVVGMELVSGKAQVESVTLGNTATLTSKSLTAPIITGSASAAGTVLFKEDTDNGTNSCTLSGPQATADVTVTLPAVTDTLVGKTTTDTLTNKTLTSPAITTPTVTGAMIVGNADTSAGLIEFLEDSDNGSNKCTLIGPAATADVTVTLPAATDTLVGKATTDTLTNKTLGAVTLSGAVTGADQEISAVTFLDVAVKTVVLGASGGGTLTLNLNLGQHFTATIDTGASVITASNFAASDEYMAWVISLTNGQSQSITWTAVDWEGGSAPTLTTSGLDLLGFYTYDGGTTIHGFPISIASA
jgi:hypothetical protein